MRATVTVHTEITDVRQLRLAGTALYAHNRGLPRGYTAGLTVTVEEAIWEVLSSGQRPAEYGFKVVELSQ